MAAVFASAPSALRARRKPLAGSQSFCQPCRRASSRVADAVSPMAVAKFISAKSSWANSVVQETLRSVESAGR